MADAIWKEYELFCTVCNTHFKQLVVLHKVPKNFDITPFLAYSHPASNPKIHFLFPPHAVYP